ncbi:MAG: cytochrome ubiquinol oxidase subunit I [Pyrobaculum sp.]
MDTTPLLWLSALGIYLHAIYISFTYGLPLAIGAVLWMWRRTRDGDFLKAAKLMTAVLSVNFALGAITGTLVEFGLVQVWPGFNFAIATFAFAPLALELIAFANEVAFLILFVVTLGRVRPAVSLSLLAVFAVFAYMSGVMIMAANSWMQAPWGVGEVPQSLYPFMPPYGPSEIEVSKLLALRAAALATGQPLSLMIEKPGAAVEVGLVLRDPMVIFYSPYAVVSAAHTILAGALIGLAVVMAGWLYRYYRSRDAKYLKIVKPMAFVFTVLFIVQAPVVAHFQGEVVAKYNPTKFALMEGAYETKYDPLKAFLAYGDPNRPIPGFDEFRKACMTHGDKTLGDLLRAAGVNSTVRLAAEYVDLTSIKGVRLSDLCLADLEKAASYMPIIHTAYYTKTAFAILGGLAALALFFYFYKAPLFSKIAGLIVKILGGERRGLLALSILTILGTVLPAVLGWYVREAGRKPWTVYGLLYPEDVVTPVPYATDPVFLTWAYAVVLAVNLGGLAGLYIIATRKDKFLKMLKKE